MSVSGTVPSRDTDLRKQHSIYPTVHDRQRRKIVPPRNCHHTDPTQVVGMNWIEVPAGKYRLLPEDKKRSLCQIELNVRYARCIVPWSRLILLIQMGSTYLACT